LSGEVLEIGLGIPFYNDSRIIGKTIFALENIDSVISKKFRVEYLFWDDGSKEAEGDALEFALSTSEILTGRYSVIRTKSNFGYGYANDGIIKFFANKDFCVVLDSELSMTQGDILEMIECFSKLSNESLQIISPNGLIIKASRFSTKSGLEDLKGSRRHWTRLGNLFARLTMGGVEDPTNGFRGLDRNAMKILRESNAYEYGFASIVEEMYLARIKKINLANSNQTYVSRKADSRPTTFVYMPKVLWKYIRICLLSAVYRVTRFVPKVYR
jgi:hypothetical protein